MNPISIENYYELKEHLSGVKRKVLDFFEANPDNDYTAYEVAYRISEHSENVKPRITELKKDNILTQTRKIKMVNTKGRVKTYGKYQFNQFILTPEPELF